MENLRDAFERVLKGNPYDALAHKVFSDWLYENGEDALAEHHALWTKEWQDADGYFREFVAGCGGCNYMNADADPNQLIEPSLAEFRRVVQHWLDTGETAIFGGGDGFGATNQFGWAPPSEGGLIGRPADEEVLATFWRHWEAWTRTKVLDEGKKADGNGPFHCCY